MPSPLPLRFRFPSPFHPRARAFGDEECPLDALPTRGPDSPCLFSIATSFPTLCGQPQTIGKPVSPRAGRRLVWQTALLTANHLSRRWGPVQRSLVTHPRAGQPRNRRGRSRWQSHTSHMKCAGKSSGLRRQPSTQVIEAWLEPKGETSGRGRSRTSRGSVTSSLPAPAPCRGRLRPPSPPLLGSTRIRGRLIEI